MILRLIKMLETILKSDSCPGLAPCCRFDQVRRLHEKGCAGQAGGEDRFLSGESNGRGEGRRSDEVRRQKSEFNSDEDLTDDLIIYGLERLTAESLAEDSDN